MNLPSLAFDHTSTDWTTLSPFLRTVLSILFRHAHSVSNVLCVQSQLSQLSHLSHLSDGSGNQNRDKEKERKKEKEREIHKKYVDESMKEWNEWMYVDMSGMGMKEKR